MLKNKKEKISNIKKKTFSLFRKGGEMAFLVFLLLTMLALIISGYFFYRYGYSAVKKEPIVTIRTIKLDETLYKQFLENYSLRRQNFHEADLKNYPNIFQKP